MTVNLSLNSQFSFEKHAGNARFINRDEGENLKITTVYEIALSGHPVSPFRILIKNTRDQNVLLMKI